MNKVVEPLFGKSSLCYQNWIAFLNDDPEDHTAEYSLITDGVIVDGIGAGLGPYKVFHSQASGGAAKPTYTLRVAVHFPDDCMDLTNNREDVQNFEHYHGGGVSEEIAALLSLSLGVRIKSSPRRRVFYAEDPKGIPIDSPFFYEREPVLVPIRYGPLLPKALKPRSFHESNALFQFKQLYLISSSDSLILVKVARKYQEALWIAESDPALCWLLLVSTIEVAANYWRKEKDTPLERMKAAKPDLLPLLEEYGGDELVQKVADKIADYMGSTKKFIDFILEFLPDPPQNRCPEVSQLDWSKKSMKKSLAKLYDYRSKALHAGQQIPAPMCYIYGLYKDGSFRETPKEDKGVTPKFVAIGVHWHTDEIPMLLQTFEFIVRGALLNWWTSMLEKNKP